MNNNLLEDRFLDLIGDLGDEYVISPIEESLAKKNVKGTSNLEEVDNQFEKIH